MFTGRRLVLEMRSRAGRFRRVFEKTRCAPALLCAAIFIIFGSPSVAQTQVATKRVALLIANGGYPDAGLPQQTAAKDAAVLNDELSRDGFDVDLQRDLNHDGMQAAIDAFLARIDQGSTALLYFNGVGIQVSHQTYLVPINAEIWSEADVKREGLNVDAVVADMNRRGASVKIVVIDASRRNPYERRFRAYSAGLASLDAPDNSLVMYAAAPNRIAPDSTGDVSLFMNELVKELRTPNISAEDAIMHTRVGVSRASNGEQVPWFASSLVDPIFLGRVTPPPAGDTSPGPSSDTPVPVAKTPAGTPPESNSPPAHVPEHVAKAPVPPPPVETYPPSAPEASPPNTGTPPAPVATAPTTPPPTDTNGVPPANPSVPSQDAGPKQTQPAKPPEAPPAADTGAQPAAKTPITTPPQAPAPQEANIAPAAKEPQATPPVASPPPQNATAAPVPAAKEPPTSPVPDAPSTPVTKAPSSPPTDTGAPPVPTTNNPPASAPPSSSADTAPAPSQPAGSPTSPPTSSGPPPDLPHPPPDYRPGTVFRDCSDCPDMMVLPLGSFFMGSGKTPVEKPIHRITLTKPFAIGQTEVTFADWARCLDAGGCTFRPDSQGFGEGDHPVINISWSDAKEYVAWLSRRTGKAYRLPSETEWEYAARGGSMTTFAWGPTVGSHNANCSECGNGVDAPHTFSVKSFPPNGYGLFDMAGNAAEWVEDCWNPSYRDAPTDGSAWLTGTCEQRVLRGGSFDSGALYVRPAARFRYDSDVRYWANGFRLARDIP